MNREKLRSKPWYPMAAAICIGVVLYVVLTRFDVIFGALRKFVGFFAPVLIGCLIAYIVNPLARLYRGKLFRGVKNEGKRTALANLLTVVTVLLFIVLMLLVILPQLLDSVRTFVGNLDGYIAALEGVMERWGLSERLGIDMDSLIDSSKNILDMVSDYVMKNLTKILNSSASAGRRLVQLVLGFILSIYLLGDKESLKAGAARLLKATLREPRYSSAMAFFSRCDAILHRYIVFNLLDSLIVGVVNAVFMVIAGMPYVGLVSFVVALTNLIPTFGPIIGGVIGAFVLVLVKPWHAVMFLVFTMILQTVDGYILKPRLFGNSLGVSGLWILIGVIVGGRMFGVAGILAAIPAVAILDDIYHEMFLPWLERRHGRSPSEDAPPAE